MGQNIVGIPVAMLMVNYDEKPLEIVLATRNQKKAEEIRRILSGLPVRILTLEDYPDCPEVVEDGETFDDNAVKKAIAVWHCTGKPSLADDSGLEVSALNGAPGTLSARYAGEPVDDARNVGKLLEALRETEERAARFVCALAFAITDRDVRIFHGTVSGTIGREPRGTHGFGYDPVFYPEGYNRTFAEMSASEKDSLSHRGKALATFKDFVAEWIRQREERQTQLSEGEQ